ncbi:MAG: M48 family metalloprotease [Verrucomicrobia bacterium]|nr:M48 family metalloprotease [Verrucomicrobiota bacterium]
MNAILGWLTSPEWAQVVKTLLHSLWQAGLFALVLGLLLRRIASPAWRYRFALGSLGGVLIAAVVSWAVLNQLSHRPETFPQTVLLPDAPLAEQGSLAPDPIGDPIVFRVAATKQAGGDSVKAGWTAWLALVWILGALVMVIRAGVQVAGAERLRRSCKPLADERVTRLLAEAQQAMQLARRIRVAVTDKLTSPAVVGVLVPTLILPLTLLTALTPEQLRFVLLHELAHIRRGDYFANLFQLFMEALLFFNPAVWWISHLVRREREACCDALAIELSGAPVDYAKTLVHVAENVMSPAPAAATAFGDGQREPSSLSDRVQRLLVPGYRPALRLTWRAMLAALLVGGALLFLSAMGARNVVGAVVTNATERVPKPIENTNATTSFQQQTSGPIETLINGIQSTQSIAQSPNKGRQAILQKLKRIKLDKVIYRGVTLNEVVQDLTGKVRKSDQEKKGINFIVDPNIPGIAYNEAWTNFVTVNMDSELREVSVEEVLNAIVKSTTMPVSYFVEDYGIVITSGKAPEPLFTRTFWLNLDVVSAALGVPIPTRLTNETHAASDPDGVTRTNEPSLLYRRLMDRIRDAGVDLQPPKSLYLGYGVGKLLVRASMKDLDAIESLLQGMDTHPPQINVKAWFYEISDDDLKVIGIDWLRANARVASVTGSNSGLCGLLTEDQFKIVQRSMEQRGGVKLLFTSEVTTLSGRQAQIIGDTKILTLTNGINPLALRSPGISTAPDSTNRLYLSNPVTIGPVLDVIPQVSFDEFAIKMTLSPSITEFLGYDKSEDSVEVYIDGKRQKASRPLPRFRVRQSEYAVVIWDGRTVVLGGLRDINISVTPDGKSQASASPKSDKQLLVFVTATVIDPAGNRVHSDKKIPFGIPPQPPPNIKSGSTNSEGRVPTLPGLNQSQPSGRAKTFTDLISSPGTSLVSSPVLPDWRLDWPSVAIKQGLVYWRTIKIDFNVVSAALGVPAPVRRANENQPASNPASETWTNEAHVFLAALKERIRSAGIEVDQPENGVGLSLNDHRGELLISAPRKAFETIVSVVEALNTPPQMINMKVKFIEVPAEQMRSVLQTVFANAPDPGTNQFIETLSEARTKAFLSALKTMPGVDVHTCPEVTTLSGRQTQMQDVEVQTFRSGMKSVLTNGSTEVIRYADSLPSRPMVDVLPTILWDRHTIQMTVTPTVNEFVGMDYQRRYDDSPIKPKPPQQLEGRALASDLPAIGIRSGSSLGVAGVTRPVPRYRIRRVTTSVSVWDGQTVLFGNIPNKEITRVKDKVPVLGDLPEVGKLFRSESSKPGRKQLIVLITPTIVDPAGNRVYPGIQVDGPNESQSFRR